MNRFIRPWRPSKGTCRPLYQRRLSRFTVHGEPISRRFSRRDTISFMVYVQMSRPRPRTVSPPVWIEPDPLPEAAPALHADPLISELLYRRGLRHDTEIRAFLDTRPRPAPDPSLLPNIDAAVDRILRAIATGERIGVFGDYDIDGISSTALMVRALRSATGDPHRIMARLPSRSAGYGLNQAAIDAFDDAGVSLLLALDCGSSDHALVAYARALGLDVVILDHHLIGDAGPDGAIVVNPYLSGDGPYRELAAVGVVYLVVSALAQHGCRVDGDNGDPETALLDYVALGTIGDVSPLLGVNRSLVRDGLRRLQQNPRVGLVALAKKVGIEPAALTADRVAFKITPRLNAAGRMADPTLALDLLLTDDPLHADALANEIERLNGERRTASARIAAEAEDQMLARPDLDDRRALIATGSGWTAGVLGIAANHLVERFGRPALVLVDDGVMSKGSARSVAGFDIVEALGRCRDLVSEFGGHSQAAGLSLPTRSIDALAAALDLLVAAAGIEVPIPRAIRLDAELSADRLVVETAQIVEMLQPFGAANEQPVFLIRDVHVRQYEAVGADRSHLRLVLSTPKGSVKAIAFGAADRSRELILNRRIDLAATMSLDRWSGRSRLDLEIKDFRPAT